MRRREFLSLLGGSAVALPRSASAESADRVRRIAVIMGFADNDEVWQNYLAIFTQRLHELGWSAGRLRIDVRFTGADVERTRAAAQELIATSPDLIFVSTNPVVSVVLQETRTIPIVFTWVSESVGSGFMPSLAHPGGNITGFHNFEPAIGGKWLGLLKQLAPAVRRVAVVHVPEIVANRTFIGPAAAAAKPFGISVDGAGVRNPDDIRRVLADFAREPDGGLIVIPSPLTATSRDLIIAIADKLRLPAIYPFRFYAASGGLIFYGNDQLETVREAASYVDRILRGASPGELPVQLPTKFQLVINLKTAGALGLKVPDAMQLLADEVIE